MTNLYRPNRNASVPSIASAALFTLVLLALPSLASGDGPEADPHAQHHATEQAMDGASEGQAGPMMDHCRAMMSHHREMMERQRAEKAELENMMEDVRSASGDAKLDAMETLLGELVERRTTMGGMMSGAPCPMMGSMMQHMGTMTGGMNEGAMEGCPMMQKMMGGSASGEDDHSAHRPGG